MIGSFEAAKLRNDWRKLLQWVRNLFTSLFSSEPVHLAIVRRYQDANGNYVGELYMENDKLGYAMIGVSLDSFWLGQDRLTLTARSSVLDTDHDFLAPMPPATIRVGALDPKDNDNVRRMIAKLPTQNMVFILKNGFIEHVLERPVVEEKWPNE